MEISSNFFHCGQADPKAKTCSSAYLNYNSIHCDHRVEFELQVKKNCDSVILKFNLVKLTTEKNGITVSKNLEGVDPLWTDWIPNEFAWPIFSESLKKMIVDSLHPNQKVDWIKCEVSHNEEIRLYYIPIYRYHEEILDKKNTRYVENTNLIMLPVFNMDAINDLDFFILPFEYGIERTFYASNRLKRKLVKEKISGIDYEKNVYVVSSDCLNNEKKQF